MSGKRIRGVVVVGDGAGVGLRYLIGGVCVDWYFYYFCFHFDIINRG